MLSHQVREQGSSASRCCLRNETDDTAVTEASDLADYVFHNRDTGTALYVTRGSASEIHRANRNLSRAGNRNRYVPARHLMDHRQSHSGQGTA